MSSLDVNAQPQVSHCQPHSLQHCPELEWALGLDYCSILLEGELHRDLGSCQTGSETPWHFLGLPSWSPGTPSGTTVCFLHPIICLPKTPVDRCQHWETP